jgi:hypothetical protein
MERGWMTDTSVMQMPWGMARRMSPAASVMQMPWGMARRMSPAASVMQMPWGMARRMSPAASGPKGKPLAGETPRRQMAGSSIEAMPTQCTAEIKILQQRMPNRPWGQPLRHPGHVGVSSKAGLSAHSSPRRRAQPGGWLAPLMHMLLASVGRVKQQRRRP